MLINLLYSIVSMIHFIFSTFWLGIFTLPFFVLLSFKIVSNSERDTLQKYASESTKPYIVLMQTMFFTIFFYGFFFIGSALLKRSLFQLSKRYALVELLENALEQKENVYLNGKQLEPSSSLLEDLLEVETRTQHRIKSGANSSPHGKRIKIQIGTHTVSLRQDNGIEYEYWVYFDDYGKIGQIDTDCFIGAERYNELVAKKR